MALGINVPMAGIVGGLLLWLGYGAVEEEVENSGCSVVWRLGSRGEFLVCWQVVDLGRAREWSSGVNRYVRRIMTGKM